jgi:hypothetical protein
VLIAIFLPPIVLLIVGALSESGGVAALGGLGLLVSLVVAIIVAIRMVVAIPALLIERLGPVEALRRSNRLIKGKTGMVLLTLIVVWIITFIIGLLLGLPFGGVGGAIGRFGGTVLTTVGQMLTSLVSNALLGVAIVLIYFDRRVRNEGYDLTELASELGEPQDRQW